MPAELVHEIAGIVHKEGYTSLMDAFPSEHVQPPIFLSEGEASDLVDLVVIEKKKARLRLPYHDDTHPKYDEKHEEEFDDMQMGIYQKTIYYVESAFKKGSFDHLLK
ncbi:hypothetical protein [Dyella acidisoli]|uniref:Uncharacterized protein n=1 Tax=Dyella acidisoli TaxID=1867834 RepID=A0ABQ5XZC8_9GAMM|nr:hypothetical protein [Dyella acidisoli]GLQ95449.1 hypothetical protein GCM10007901_44040 [Dyella acidisoli]